MNIKNLVIKIIPFYLPQTYTLIELNSFLATIRETSSIDLFLLSPFLPELERTPFYQNLTRHYNKGTN